MNRSRRNSRKKKIIYNAKLMAVSAGMLLFSINLQTYGNTQVPEKIVAHSETRIPVTVEMKLPDITKDTVTVETEEYGFSFYKVPFGELPEDVQIYTHEICKQYGIPTEVVFAIMKRESKFNRFAVGDEGESFGYMQVMKKWHKERMERLGVDDLESPEGNILVAVDFLSELYGKYGNMTCALMAYNCGEATAKRLWNDGTWQTKYTIEVLQSSEEIRKEIYGGEQ